MGEEIGGGPAISLIEAPALAELTRRLLKLPAYMLDGRPFAVEPDLYDRASTEFHQIMRDRGWWVLSDEKTPLPNFLYRGVPIIPGDE